MKVLLLNGSRRSRGCTRTALDIVASELDAAGIDTVFMDVGLRVLKGELFLTDCSGREVLNSKENRAQSSHLQEEPGLQPRSKFLTNIRPYAGCP